MPHDCRPQSLFANKFGLWVGFGYDDSQLKEQRHPTRDDLDKVASDIPVIAIHQSSHFGAFKALKLADFVVLSGNPMTMPRESLGALQVLRTVKEGKTIYSRP